MDPKLSRDWVKFGLKFGLVGSSKLNSRLDLMDEFTDVVDGGWFGCGPLLVALAVPLVVEASMPSTELREVRRRDDVP